MSTKPVMSDQTPLSGGPMNDQQLAEYLRELRTNRAVRLNGSRPPPPSRIASTRQRPSTSAGESILPSASPQTPKDEPAQTAVIDYRAHGRAKSMDTGTRGAFAGRPLFPAPSPLPLIPDGDEISGSPPRAPLSRQGSQEIDSVLKSLEVVDLDEELRIHSAAQDEAAELVHKHRTGVKDSPSSAYKNPDASSDQTKKDYRSHLRTRSALPWNSSAETTSPKSTPPKSTPLRPGPFVTTDPRPASSPCAMTRVNARFNLTETLTEQEDPFVEPVEAPRSSKGKSYEKLAGAVATDIAESRRRASSGANKRKPSDGSKGAFPSPDDRIFEEQDDSLKEARAVESEKAADKAQEKTDEVPRYARRNPFARVRQAQEKFEKKESPSGFSVKKLEKEDGAVTPNPPSGKRFDRIEIHRNPPSQTRRAGYTTNETPPPTPPVPAVEEDSEFGVNPLILKDGKEVRGDDIRAATAMRRKDRSSNLIQPTAVSDSPGRPIVSFQNDWKTKEIELKEERVDALPASLTIGTAAPSSEALSGKSRPYSPTQQPKQHSSAFRVQQSKFVQPPIPHVAVPDSPSTYFELPGSQKSMAELSRGIPTINIPIINVPDDPALPPSPVLAEEPDVPSIMLHSDTSKPPVPIINEPVAVLDSSRPRSSARPLPTPTKSSPGKAGPSRPLPFTASSSPFPTAARPHYTPSVRRNTALCAHCALPIAGRILSAAGERFHPACFKCHACSINLECVAFYPEPEPKRLERLARIHQRQQGLDTHMPEGVTEEDMLELEEQDGDAGLRFFCHLDFHELFSPRCKSCKTPIEGEVVVACGSEWHVGHFFCAQCGDPFDSSTPFVEKEGYAWCVGCHTNRYSAKCKRCRKPVTDVVVKALGTEWHAECFVCNECNGQFEDGRYFLRGADQNPVCVRCEDRRLKA